MNKLKAFKNPAFGSIRTLQKDDEPWFIGKDVAEVLGYSNTRDALTKHVENEDKANVAIHDGSQKKKYGAYQRIWLVQLDSIQQVTNGKAIQTLGYI